VPTLPVLPRPLPPGETQASSCQHRARSSYSRGPTPDSNAKRRRSEPFPKEAKAEGIRAAAPGWAGVTVGGGTLAGVDSCGVLPWSVDALLYVIVLTGCNSVLGFFLA